MALGTRYVAMDASWPVYRRLISWATRILARPLTTASNPVLGSAPCERTRWVYSLPSPPR
ncbi:hypothetical protein B0H14DRAFT_2384150 [Mycena olivaceomarginata]|nr:hypothetical protein B0H14DRAFT_2384150 [Mycena olivaceomarginata]